MPRTLLLAAIAISIELAAVVTAAAVQVPALEEVLARAAAYTRRLHAQLAGIVAEETYVQDVRSTVDSSIRPFAPRHRTLASDLLLVTPAGEHRYVEYRDVFEVDGSPVRDRRERLTALFLRPGDTSRRQIEAITNEGARYNIGDIPRNINTPMLTLSFLLADTQPRFRFTRGRHGAPALSGGAAKDEPAPPVFRAAAELWVIEFREVWRPTVIRTNQDRDFPAAGRFWVDPQTGAVLMSELRMDNGKVSATINVSYQAELLLGFNVPAEMRERYEASGSAVDGRATYGRFRQFQVRTRETIAKPPGS